MTLGALLLATPQSLPPGADRRTVTASDDRAASVDDVLAADGGPESAQVLMQPPEAEMPAQAASLSSTDSPPPRPPAPLSRGPSPVPESPAPVPESPAPESPASTPPVPTPEPAPGPPSGSGVWVYASWFGPGFYGSRTACGDVFTDQSWGVAHRTLPCGTVVSISFEGRTVSTPVIDRGPYVGGRELDLAEAVARSLGFTGVQPVQMSIR